MTLTISQGTHFSDGVRSGPRYSPQLYTTYGYGVLHSTQYTYNITPSPPGTAEGNTILNNVVATTTSGGVPVAGYLTLRGDNASTYYMTGPNGFPLIQFDWPRVPTVTISGANATANTHVTIFGNDVYGYPMQMTYIVQAQQTYPTVTPGELGGSISVPAKSFYNVTGVYVNAALPTGCFISVGASDIFGLPYLVTSPGVISSISWGAQTVEGGLILPISELTLLTFDLPITTRGVFIRADLTNPATAISGDVRGLYAPSSPSAAQIVSGTAINWKNLVFTYYVAGMDTWINQVAAQQIEYQQQTGLPPQGIPISPLMASDAYGVPQFYTGSPS